jgi:hypothetical protein
MRNFFRALPIYIALIALVPLQGGAQTLFMQDAAEVDQLAVIFVKAGRVFPTTSFPVSKAELARFADILAANADDRTAQDLSEYRLQTLKFDTDQDWLATVGKANFEYTYRTQNISFDPGLHPELQVLDLRRLFLDRLPLGALQLDYARDAGFELGIAARFARDYFMYPFNPTNLPESEPGAGDPVALENQNIMRGFLWYDFHPLQIELGRDKIQMGPSKSSLLPSADLPFLDMLRLRLPLGRLTGDLVISTLENRASGHDVTPNGSDPPFGLSVILVAIHRYEYAFDTVRLGIAAICVYARNGNAFNLGDIFPVFSWHQADIGPNNTSFVADASWVPFSGFTLSAQVGLDDVNLSGAGINDSALPTIPAVIVNAAYLWGAAPGLSIDFNCEAGYTHYLWGNFALDSSGADPLARAIDRYRMDGGVVILPLTSPFGPGATWVDLTASLRGLAWLDASIRVRYFSRMTDPGTGQPVNLVDTLYARSGAIESAPHVDTWSVGCKLATLPFGFVRLSVEPTVYMQIDNRSGTRTTWLGMALGAGIVGKSLTSIAQHP